MTGVLARMPNWLGDAIMALPALDALAEGLGGPPLAVACRPGLADVYRAHPAVDAWVDADDAPGKLAPRRFPVAALRAVDRGDDARDRVVAALADAGGRFDLGVLFTNSFSSAWRQWRLGTRWRCGYARDGRRPLLNRAVPCPPSARAQHVVSFYRHLVDELLRRLPPAPRRDKTGGGGNDGEEGRRSGNESAQAPLDPATGLPIPRLRIPADLRRAAATLRERLKVDGPYAVLAPFSAYGEVKDWPAERYAEIAARLAARGRTVLITGAADQENDCEDIRRLAMGAAYHHTTCAPDDAARGRVLNSAGETTAGVFLGLLAEAALFVGGDSGGAHAAAALGVRTVAIFTVTEPSHSRPLGMDVRVVDDGKGAGDGAEPKLRSADMARRRAEALTALTVDRVWKAVVEEKKHP